MSTDKPTPLEDQPPGPAIHDRRNEPPGGYRHQEDRGDMPDGWREVPEDEQHTPAGPEDEPRTP